jgi:hypothetical protein
MKHQNLELELLKKYGKDTAELELQILNERNDINLKFDEQERNRIKEQKAKDEEEANAEEIVRLRAKKWLEEERLED